MTKVTNWLEHEIITLRGKRIWVCLHHFCDKDGQIVENDNNRIYCDICKCVVLDIDIWTHGKRHADK